MLSIVPSVKYCFIELVTAFGLGDLRAPFIRGILSDKYLSLPSNSSQSAVLKGFFDIALAPLRYRDST